MSSPGEHPQPAPRGSVQVDDGCGAVRLDVVISAPTPGRPRCVNLRMSWDPADPLGVVLEVSATPDHPALPRGRWVILRDFLRYGLDAPTGDGEVRISPQSSDGVPDLVHVTLARPGRPAVLALPAGLLARFLDETERRVPVGEERPDALLDAFIERLLQSS